MKKGTNGVKYRTYDKDFKQIALEGKRSEAAIAKDLGIHPCPDFFFITDYTVEIIIKKLNARY